MTAGARAVVQSQDVFNAAGEFLREVDGASNAAVLAALVVVVDHFDVEHFAKVARSAVEHYAMPRRGSFQDFKSVQPAEAFHFSQGVWMSAVMSFEVFPGKVAAVAGEAAGEGFVDM
jgi:hypothetical protein